jgi:hypothetical protein
MSLLPPDNQLENSNPPGGIVPIEQEHGQDHGPSGSATSLMDIRAKNPFHPFASEADFSFAFYVINSGLSSKKIDSLIETHRRWSDNSRVGFKSHRDIKKVLDLAVRRTTQVLSYSIGDLVLIQSNLVRAA